MHRFNIKICETRFVENQNNVQKSRSIATTAVELTNAVNAMRTAYNTYNSLTNSRKTTSLVGSVVAATPMLYRTFFGDSSASSSSSFQTKIFIFLFGLSTGMLICSELRWYLSDKNLYCDAKERAIESSLEIAKSNVGFENDDPDFYDCDQRQL